MSSIISLTAENVKRLKAVRVEPDGAATVVVGGRNGAGKSSLLDCISMALGGKDQVPSEAIRRGQDKARIVLETEDLVVIRRFTPSGTTLEVTNKDGLKFPSPQAVLDKLTNSLAFDPLAFVRSEPKAQLAQLRALVGIDTTELDQRRKLLFDNRTERNREVRNQTAVVAELPETGPARICVQSLLQELDAAQAHNAQRAGLEAAVADSQRRHSNFREAIEQGKSRVEKLREQIRQLTEQADKERESIRVHEESFAMEQTELERSRQVLAEFRDKPIDPIRQQIAQAESTNQAAARVERRAAEQAKLDAVKATADKLTKEIEAVDKEREALLASASFPVPGLGLGESGVTLNDLPLEQASSAEQLRVGLAVACALNPKLKVMLIRDGSLLDEDSMKLVDEFAAAQGAQVWIERVGDDGRCTVVIEDGELVLEEATA